MIYVGYISKCEKKLNNVSNKILNVKSIFHLILLFTEIIIYLSELIFFKNLIILSKRKIYNLKISCLFNLECIK